MLFFLPELSLKLIMKIFGRWFGWKGTYNFNITWKLSCAAYWGLFCYVLIFFAHKGGPGSHFLVLPPSPRISFFVPFSSFFSPMEKTIKSWDRPAACLLLLTKCTVKNWNWPQVWHVLWWLPCPCAIRSCWFFTSHAPPTPMHIKGWHRPTAWHIL